MLTFSKPYSQFLPWTNVILFDVCAYRALLNCQAYSSRTLMMKLIVVSCWLIQKRIDSKSLLRKKRKVRVG